MDQKPDWLHRYTVLLAGMTLFLVVAGASVTSKEAGLSVPDWPLSYGQVMPEMKGGVFYEHGHRMVATTVGLMTIVLAVWLSRVEERRWLRRLGWIALAAVVVQGILGGMTVLFLLPRPVSIAHACLAELFFAATCAVALFTSASWKRGPELVDPSGWPTRPSGALWIPAAVLAQVALGASFRHKALDLTWHVLGAAAVTGLILYACVSQLMNYPRHQELRRAAAALLAVTFVQVFLGVAAYMSRIATVDAPQPMPVMVFFTVAHVAAGALTMATSLLLAIQVHRHARPPLPSPPVTEASYARTA